MQIEQDYRSNPEPDPITLCLNISSSTIDLSRFTGQRI